MKTIQNAAQFLHDSGLLFEVNRTVLHPFGRALRVALDENTGVPFQLDMVKTDDITGIEFGPESMAEGYAKLGQFMEQEGDLRLQARSQALGFVIQDEPFPEEPFTLATLQEEHAAWERHNFGVQPAHRSFFGIVEEVGELAHALLKSEQGIRGSQEKFDQLAQDALGDILVFMASYANKRGWDLQEILEQVWGEVKQRDWKRFPKNGLSE